MAQNITKNNLGFRLNNIKIDNQPMYILDAACGIGFNTKMLNEHIPNSILYGVDMCINSITLANKYNKDNNTTYISEDLHLFTFQTPILYILAKIYKNNIQLYSK